VNTWQWALVAAAAILVAEALILAFIHAATRIPTPKPDREHHEH
jgi:hypothetical protein